MKAIRERLFDIRDGEGLPTLLMFCYIFMIVSSLMILKPVRNSIFLVTLGAEKLPYVFILVALFAALVSYLRTKLDKNRGLHQQILSSLVIFAVSFLAFWLLFRAGYKHSWFLFGFYVWVSMFAVVSSTQFWLLANHIYNARQARRLFGVIGAGAISGAIFGGYLTNILAPRLHTENMIIFCVAFVTVCIGLLLLIWKVATKKSRPGRPLKQNIRIVSGKDAGPIKLILGSKHLLYLSGLIWTGVCVGNLADYQFNAIASQSITDEDDLTAFFGFWLSNLNILSLAIQLFLTFRVTKNYGVGVSLLFLPVGLLVGTTAVLIQPRIWSAVFIKISDGAFKHSINRAGMELLYLPIPDRVKNKAKSFIDVVIKNLATGFAGVLLVILTAMHVSVRYVGVANFLLIAFWVLLIIRLKREYVESFRRAVLKRTINLDQQSVRIEDASVFGSMVKVLEGQNVRQILYVLSLLEGIRDNKLVPYLTKLTTHPSDEVKAVALRLARQYDELDLTVSATALATASAQSVRLEAIEYLCERSENKLGTLRGFLDHSDYSVQDTALLCAAREWRNSKEFRDAVDIRTYIEEKHKAVLGERGEEDRVRSFLSNTARAVGIAGDHRLHPYLASMFNVAKYPDVVQAAVEGAGETGDMDFVPLLVQQLKTKNIRRFARESLSRYGDRIVDVLIKYYENPLEDVRVRYAIPGVLSAVNSQVSVNALQRNLDQENMILRYAAIKALNKLRSKRADFKFNKHVIEKRIFEEVAMYQETASLMFQRQSLERNPRSEGQSETAGKACLLLIRALGERLDYNLERIFRLLGLRYNPKDMYDAYFGVNSDKPNLRADAIEFLDNVLDRNLKNVIIPIVENRFETFSQKSVGGTTPSGDRSIEILIDVPDDWIRVCTLYVIAETGRTDIAIRVSPLQNDANPVVRETARYCLTKMTAMV